MAVRNFWIDANIDGRKTELAGGPASKEGGMNVSIKQRDKGGIVTAFKVYCIEQDGMLYTEVYNGEGKLAASFVSER